MQPGLRPGLHGWTLAREVVTVNVIAVPDLGIAFDRAAVTLDELVNDRAGLTRFLRRRRQCVRRNGSRIRGSTSGRDARPVVGDLDLDVVGVRQRVSIVIVRVRRGPMSACAAVRSS